MQVPMCAMSSQQAIEQLDNEYSFLYWGNQFISFHAKIQRFSSAEADDTELFFS